MPTRGGYDFLIQGMSGLMSITGRRDGEPGAGPMKVGVPVSDLFTGLYAAARDPRRAAAPPRDRRRASISTARCSTARWRCWSNQAMNYLVGGMVPKRLGNAHPNVVPYRDFPPPTAHVLVACGNDGQFRALCRLLGRPDLAADAAYADNAGRLRNRVALEAALAEAIATWRSADLFAAMTASGVPGGPVNRIDQILADPQIEAREMLRTMHRDDGTDVR